MKTAKSPRLAVFMLAALPLMMASSVCASAATETLGGLSVDVQPNKQDYVLGEVVKLSIRITNVSRQAIEVPELPSMTNGLIRLFVADNGTFREYEWPGVHADVDGTGVEIAPSEVAEAEATIMYLNRRETKHLSELYARDIREKYLDTDYAFVKAGTYRVKAVVLAGDARLESQPVTIRVHEPKGADLQVWQVLQADPELGYFVQLGAPKAGLHSAKSKALTRTLSALTAAHPESHQAGDIRLSLAKYQDALQALSPKQEE